MSIAVLGAIGLVTDTAARLLLIFPASVCKHCLSLGSFPKSKYRQDTPPVCQGDLCSLRSGLDTVSPCTRSPDCTLLQAEGAMTMATWHLLPSSPRASLSHVGMH